MGYEAAPGASEPPDATTAAVARRGQLRRQQFFAMVFERLMNLMRNMMRYAWGRGERGVLTLPPGGGLRDFNVLELMDCFDSGWLPCFSCRITLPCFDYLYQPPGWLGVPGRQQVIFVWFVCNNCKNKESGRN